MNPNKRPIVVSSLVILLMITNFTRLKGSESIRPIFIVTLLVIGAAIAVLLMNLVLLLKNRNN